MTLLNARRLFAHRQVDDLLAEAAARISAARKGGLEQVSDASLAISRAERIIRAELDVDERAGPPSSARQALGASRRPR